MTHRFQNVICNYKARVHRFLHWEKKISINNLMVSRLVGKHRNTRDEFKTMIWHCVEFFIWSLFDSEMSCSLKKDIVFFDALLEALGKSRQVLTCEVGRFSLQTCWNFSVFTAKKTLLNSTCFLWQTIFSQRSLKFALVDKRLLDTYFS